MTAGCTAIAAILLCREVDPHGLVQFIPVNLNFDLTTYKEGAPNEVLRLADARHAYKTPCLLHFETVLMKMKNYAFKVFFKIVSNATIITKIYFNLSWK